MLFDNSEKASNEARKTLDKMKNAMGINYKKLLK